MKKLILILTFLVLLTAIFTLSAFADGNIADQATLSTSATHWHVVGNGGWAKYCIPYLTDGNYDTGISACAYSRVMYVYFEFESEQQIENIILYCNGSAQAGNIGYWSDMNADRNIGIYVHDENGKLVFEKWLNTLNQTKLEYTPEQMIKGKKVTLRFDSDYIAEYALLRELEIYNHICYFNEFKEEIKAPTCTEDGTGLFACTCGQTEEQVLLATGVHTYTDIDALVYENGFLANGLKSLGCPTCDDYITREELPIFKNLGYSLSRNKKSMCVSYVVDKELISIYEQSNKTTLSYGMLCAVTDNVQPLNKDGTVAPSINGQSKALNETDFPRFDIKISALSWDNVLNTPIIMCAYIIDGDKLTYICGEANTENAIPITYNQLNPMPI